MSSLVLLFIPKFMLKVVHVQWKRQHNIIQSRFFYRGYNSRGCCHYRKVLLPFSLWICGCRPLSPNGVWFTACYLLLPLSRRTIWFHLGSQPCLRALCQHNERRRYSSQPKHPKLCIVSGKKKGKSYFIWLVLKIPNFFKMLRFFMVQIKRSYIFPKAACVSDHCFIANENCPPKKEKKKKDGMYRV